MKSLGTLLSELSAPLPKDKDPELMDVHSSDEESDASDSSDKGLQNHHYLTVGKGNIKNQLDLQVDQETYKGKKISRSEWNEDDDQDEFDSDEYEEGSSDEDQDKDKDMSESNYQLDNYDTESDNESQGSESNAYSQTQRNEINQELQKIKIEEKNLLSSLSKGTKQDVIKGKNIQNQKSLWDGLLNLRIRMQKLVTNANQLPCDEAYHDLFSEQEEQDLVRDVTKEMSSVLSELIKIRVSWFEDIPELSAKKRRFGELDDKSQDYEQDLYKCLQQLDTDFLPYRNQVIDKWNHKVQMMNGSTSQKNFKIINQSILNQLNSSLQQDHERLVKRTRLNRSNIIVFGKQDDNTRDEYDVDAHLKDYNDAIYNDDDFYQELLKELIESRMGDADPTALAIQWSKINKLKKKKKVDTKASKGRKIRFQVQEKLLNFMAPEPRGSWHESMSEELFSCLFGSNSNDNNVSKSVEDHENLVNGFPLFNKS